MSPENASTGEIRVHIEKKPAGGAVGCPAFSKQLSMHQTKDRNGVLLYIAPERREFAILGDSGIDEVVPDGFWDEERDLLLSHFKKGDFCGGVVAVLLQIGEKLKAFFPGVPDDINELPDDISYE
ncbi:MAG: TPM domain-containing protein [Saprospiraceae bacterium]